MKNDSLVLHIRLTTKCNADCDYCSAYDPLAGKPMGYNEFKKSIDQIGLWVKDLGIGGKRENITIQYLGGELLTMPMELLGDCVKYVRDTLGSMFRFQKDGAQTNMIGSSAKVNNLVAVFGAGKIGTSVDSFTGQRKTGGSTDKYKSIFFKNQNDFKSSYGSFAPGIIVVDDKSLRHLQSEIEIANKEKYNLTLRPVFSGGKDITRESVGSLIPEYRKAFRAWALKSKIMIQPFYQLLAARLGEKNPKLKNLYTYNTGCPFQSDCATHSLDLEPNGDVYICMDMADSKQHKLGNAITGDFDMDLWGKIKARPDHLEESCRSCDYVSVCQGGCMSEAIHHSGDMYGKTEYCDLWKMLFAEIDDLIEKNNAEKIAHWLSFIEIKNTPKNEKD